VYSQLAVRSPYGAGARRVRGETVDRQCRGRRYRRFAAVLAVLLTEFSPLVLVAPPATFAEEAPASAPLVFRRTRIETRPATTEASLSMERRAHEGLEERSGSTSAGGVIVDLKGRLGSLLTVGSGSGVPHISCVEQPPVSVKP
jgi:hypothetical protein